MTRPAPNGPRTIPQAIRLGEVQRTASVCAGNIGFADVRSKTKCGCWLPPRTNLLTHGTLSTPARTLTSSTRKGERSWGVAANLRYGYCRLFSGGYVGFFAVVHRALGRPPAGRTRVASSHLAHFWGAQKFACGRMGRLAEFDSLVVVHATCRLAGGGGSVSLRRARQLGPGPDDVPSAHALFTRVDRC